MLCSSSPSPCQHKALIAVFSLPPPHLGIFLGTKKDYQSLAPRWQGQGWEWGQSAFEKQSRLGDQLGEEGAEPEGGKGDEDKTSGWLGLTSCPLGDSPDDPSAAILSSFIGYSFKARLQRQAGEEHGWEGVPGRTTQNLHGSVPSFPDCFPHPAANSNYIFTHRSLHPRHHSQPLPHVGGGYCYSHVTDKETETRVVRSMAGKLEESNPLQDQRGALTSHPQPVKWCSKADLAVPIFQMGHLEAQRGRRVTENKQRSWSPKEKQMRVVPHHPEPRSRLPLQRRASVGGGSGKEV